MAGEDPLFFELLDAFRAGGCPLCRLGQRAAARYLDTLNYEGVNDPGLRQALQKAQGLCHRHAWQWTRMRGSPLGVAIVYRHLVKDLATVMENGTKAWTGLRRGRRSPAAGLQPTGPCPACAVELEAVERYGRTLLARLNHPDLAPAYDAAGGLCLPHLRAALALADEEQARILQTRQLAVYRRLIAQLDEFIRKHDHRFRHEPFGVEKDAWARAVALVAGEAENV
ncbi:MAG: DUF6062 family protein [Anaerolineae bacterium]|nr:DUF6062 family protein [Caldilineales bacterium]MDW8268779.1 DUF6062 family protein [Anaerolineae bacterium]